jgi:hypothetical protein
MNNTSIIKIEALTLNQKVLDQIEWHDYDKLMEGSTIGWYTEKSNIRVIARTLEGRFFKASVSRPLEIKNKFPQIFIK